jgi:heat shock protein HtpX
LEDIMTSQIKTGMFLALLTGLLLLIGQAMGGRGGLVIALVFAVGLNFVSYWFSDRIVLAMYRAQELAPDDAPGLFAIVRELAERAHLPMPRLYLIPEDAPNAFATGRDPAHAVLAVTEGLVRSLTPDEVRGVLGHEMGHVANRDILIQSVAATVAGAISSLAGMIRWGAIFGAGRDAEDGGNPVGAILMAITAPIAALLIQMAISRSREFGADAAGARLAGNPMYLASALAKIDAASRALPMGSGCPATAHMFIVSPFSGGGLLSLFSTHPPVAERIERLRQMAAGGRGW